MTITSNQVTVTDVATLIIAGTVAGAQAHIMNHGSEAVYLGGSTVTAVNGVKLIANWIHPINLSPGSALYAICSSGKSVTVSYMLTNQAQA